MTNNSKETRIFLFSGSNRINKNPNLKKCYRCDKSLYKGEMIVSKTGKTKKKRYHKKCAEDCNII